MAFWSARLHTRPERAAITVEAPLWFDARNLAMREFDCGPQDVSVTPLPAPPLPPPAPTKKRKNK